ncbi:hypothetical protein [Nocardia sp. CA-290969]|uniref:hypothetical protein n=1 Tax=Nocardia sp. CA-290969 TaxID=3239986 RepID=UPI003D8D8F15
MSEYIRFQSAVPNRHGRYPGVFAMVNGLARYGLLGSAGSEWLRAANAYMNSAYPDPTGITPDCYDPQVNPGARAWFKGDASGLLEATRGYLDLLDRAGIGWVELRTAYPGRIVHDDAVQVVAVPYRYPDDWPLAPSRSGRDRKSL